MPTISVIMPVYNTEEFLDHSIQSLLSQTYQDWELLLINDASTDDSKEIIEKYAQMNGKIKAFHFDIRKGVGAARNFGVGQAIGKYIYFLDSDDYLAEDTLQLLIENINDYDVICGKMVASHVSGKTKEEILQSKELLQEVELYTEEKYRLIGNNSVLNKLFKKSFIDRHQLHFSENVEIYADLTFVILAFLQTKEVPYLDSSIYFKRKRNDPISNPALMQTAVEDRVKDFLYVYNALKDAYTENELHTFLDNQLLRLYRKTIVGFFRKNENVDGIYTELKASVKRIHPANLKKHRYVIKKEIKTLMKGDIDDFKKVNLWHHRFRKIKNALKGRTRFYIQLYRGLFLRLPMEEKTVVFESFLGKSYSDNPKYIYEYMIQNNMDYKYVWIVREKKDIPGNPIQVKRFSLRYYYYFARAKYWVSNSRLPRTLHKRDGNVYLQTWHGTPLKTLVFDIKDIYSADPKYKKNFYLQSRRWDYLSSPNQYSSDIFRRAFKYENELLEFGYPRNDILYQKNTEKDILALKKEMNLPTDKKVILYAPTWRDDEFYSRGNYKFTLQLELNELQKKFGSEYVIVLRMHYFIASQLDISEFSEFAYDFSKYDDIAELYLVSDILITDYSSVFFDYANLRRPILFYTYDLEKYRDKLRGFYIDIEKEVPGPLLMTTEEVIDAIQHIEDVKTTYEKRYEQFYNRFCQWDDGKASEKTVKRVFLD